MNDGDHIIWTNYHLNYDDWADALETAYPELSEDERYYKMLDLNDTYLDDERANLNIQLSEPILVIADGHDFVSWYVDRKGDLRCEDIHHDGTNHYLYRVYTSGSTEAQRTLLKDKIYDGTATDRDIDRYTRRLGDEIGRVYGWTFQKEKTTQEKER